MNSANNTVVILSNNSRQHFLAISDRLEAMHIAKEVIYLQFPDEVVRATPETGPCIIVTDSLLVSTAMGNSPTAGVETLVKKAKEKNPGCKIILYTVQPFDLPKSMFDEFIVATQANSYELLLEKIKTYCKAKV
jgi:hypothetical protein